MARFSLWLVLMGFPAASTAAESKPDFSGIWKLLNGQHPPAITHATKSLAGVLLEKPPLHPKLHGVIGMDVLNAAGSPSHAPDAGGGAWRPGCTGSRTRYRAVLMLG